jgi:glucosamine--fructose-6-phosphate aminotransferase (isomerizing)
MTQVIDKEGYAHFMLKEIHENPTVIRQVAQSPGDHLKQLAQVIKKARRVFTIGSGTAGIAAAQLAFYLRQYGEIKATSLVGADAIEYYDLFGVGDVLIAPSQSGETADVLEVLELAQQKGVTIVTYVNMQGATMTRLADLPFLTQAGPEISVVSTKVFTAQIAWGYLVAKTVQGKLSQGQKQLLTLAAEMEVYLNDWAMVTQLKAVAEYLATQKDIFLLAKAQCFQIIREGMIKLIESTYRHAHALPAGDLKHYAITLIEPGVPVVVVTAKDAAESDVLTAAQEVKARGALVIGIGPTSDPSFEQHLSVPDLGETAAIMSVVPLQLLSYYAAVSLDRDVDHPRNIAKSVTVK